MKTLPILLCTAATLLSLLAGCKDAVPADSPEPPAPIAQGKQLRFPPGHPQLALLKTTAAAPGQAVTVELPARLVWNEERTQRVVPAFAGRVRAIQADVGRPVKAGSVLALLDAPDFGAAQADVAKAEVDAALTAKALARQRELHDAGIAARKDLEQAEADAARAGAELQRARARASLYGAHTAIDQTLALRATMPGVVVERNLNPGQELRPDPYGPGVPPPFVVSDPTTLWVLVDARESDAAALRPGAVFQLAVPTLPGRAFEARITSVADAIDPGTRTVKVRGVVANPERLLRAEMLATARFQRAAVGVVVPSSAVALAGGEHLVYVEAAPGVFEPRSVTLGVQNGSQTVVSQGLQAGERVVSDNMLLLARQFRLAHEDAAVAAR